MTTITREDWDTLQRIAGRIGGRFVLNDGITIADPEPPEAMVKLARGQVVAQAPMGEWGQWERGFVAALQHVEKLVRNAPVISPPARLCGGPLVGRNYILLTIGAEP